MTILMLAVLALPLTGVALHLWAAWLLRRHGGDRPEFPGTGAELARHLLDGAGLQHVRVETVETGDHYDPEAKAVRLARRHAEGRSLSAVAVAAHECAHAVQDRDGFPPLRLRTRFVAAAVWLETIGRWALLLAVTLAGVVKVPSLGLIGGAIAFAVYLVKVATHAATLPVELDASFRRALPALANGRYVPARDLLAARRILTACALTYVAGALASLLNLARWLLPWRR